MLYDEWGSVDGDHNADAIIRDRRTERSTLNKISLVLGLPFYPSLIWYGMTGSHVALAVAMFFSVTVIQAAIEFSSFKTHTFVLIAERRAQLLEQKVRHLENLALETKSGVDRVADAFSPARRYGSDL